MLPAPIGRHNVRGRLKETPEADQKDTRGEGLGQFASLFVAIEVEGELVFLPEGDGDYEPPEEDTSEGDTSGEAI
jgi:hypothetical protein